MADPIGFESKRDEMLKRKLSAAIELRQKSIKSFFDIFSEIPNRLRQIRHAHLLVLEAKAEKKIADLGRELARLNGRSREQEATLEALKAEYKALTGKNLE
jgi:predicted  nucleic acid-binding Zn-ribbon protein